MKRWTIALGALAVAFLAISCSGSSSSSPADKPGDKGEKTAASPEAPAGADKVTGAVEVTAFKGGYDIDLYKQFADEYAKANPGLTPDVTGDPRIWEKLRGRMNAGTPPDLMFPGWGMDHWALIEEGQVMTLDKALDSPSYDKKGTWRDTFDPNILKLCQKDGKTYLLPYYLMVYGWWYDPGVFAKNGWTVPKTINELVALSDKIKAKGMAPITFQGQYPYYMIEGMLLPWAASAGGVDAVKSAENLEPGAWKSAAFLKAAQTIDDLNKKGFYENGAVGLSHTDAQSDFLHGKAAMLPCGSWLYTEMANSIPPGAKMAFMLPPVLDGGKGDPTALLIGVEPWMIPTGAKNPNAAVGLFKYMTSQAKVKEFVQKKATLMALKGSDQGPLPEVLVKQAEAVKSSKTLYSNQFRQWYPACEKEIEGALTSMLNKEITPQQFVDRCEAAAEKTRKDSSIAKYKVAG